MVLFSVLPSQLNDASTFSGLSQLMLFLLSWESKFYKYWTENPLDSGFIIKNDGSFVTQIELDFTFSFIEFISSLFPDDSILTEETKEIRKSGKRTWILDPIDGTSNFVKRIHIWGTLLSLTDQHGELFSYIAAPSLNSVWIAFRGHGCWRYNPRENFWFKIERLEVSCPTNDLGVFSTSDFRDLDLHKELLKVKTNLHQFKKVRAFGDFLSHCYVAEKSIQFAVSTKTKIWDYSALKLLILESGGKYFIYHTKNNHDIFISTNLDESRLQNLI